jgi:hypothetical protein
MTIGSVTSATGATTSALRYPTAQKAAAEQLATALGLPAADLQPAAVRHLTLVLAGSDAAQVKAAADRITC